MLLGIILTTCKKDPVVDITPEPPPPPPVTYTDKIVLSSSPSSQGALTFTWSSLNNPDFSNYFFVRRENASDPGVMLLHSSNRNDTIAVDNAPPYVSYLEYQVTGSLWSGKTIKSNIITYTRPQIQMLAISPFDVQFDRENRLLYFFEKAGTISIYSLQEKRVTKSINTAATIGYCDFGVNKGTRVLYVPRNDGWIFVYDALTLEKTDQINVGVHSSCVVAHNNLLFVVTPYGRKHLRAFDRETGNLLSEVEEMYLTRVKKVPGSNVELVAQTFDISPPDQDYFSFSPTGELLVHKDDLYHGEYNSTSFLFEFFPWGDKYITSSFGIIFDKYMVYQSTLPRGSLEFTSFDFDSENKLIFAGTRSKTIEVYSDPRYHHVRTIPTPLYPYRVFNDGSNGILCISSTTPLLFYDNPQKVVIETYQ